MQPWKKLIPTTGWAEIPVPDTGTDNTPAGTPTVPQMPPAP